MKLFKNNILFNIKQIINPKKTIYIHIGMGKTGTTALQDFFWSNRDALESRGISYPDIGIVAGAHHLLSPHQPIFLQSSFSYLDIFEWTPQVSQTSKYKILISSELYAWASEENITRFCNEIAKRFHIKIIVYLRRQDNLIMAGYNQQVKAGTQKRDINAVLQQQMSRFDYLKILEPWVNVAGKENIIIRPYERQQFYCDDIRYDFLYHVFGIEDFSHFKITSANTNPRLSFAAMEYKRWINNNLDHIDDSSKFNSILLEYSSATDNLSTNIFSENPILSPAQRLDILKQCESVNNTIAFEFLGRHDGTLFYDPLPCIDEPWSAPEFSKMEFYKITKFIQENRPDLFDILRNSIPDNVPFSLD